jgi:hypothetical protein
MARRLCGARGRNRTNDTVIFSHLLCNTINGLLLDPEHGHPLELKRKLLEEWADHVEGLTTPAGVRRFR